MNTKDILDLTPVREDDSSESGYSLYLMWHVWICLEAGLGIWPSPINVGVG